MSNLQPNYMSNQMQSVAAQAAIGQEPVCRTVTFAITGDKETDMIAGILQVLNSCEGVTGPRHAGDDYQRVFQRVCEYLARRFKDQADVNEQIARRHEKAFGTIGLAGTNPKPRTWASGSVEPWDDSNPDFVKFRARLIAEMTSNAQSGTHSPSTQYPDSLGGSAWPEDGLDMKGPPSTLGG